MTLAQNILLTKCVHTVPNKHLKLHDTVITYICLNIYIYIYVKLCICIIYTL